MANILSSILSPIKADHLSSDRKDDPARQTKEQAIAVADSYMYRSQGGFESYNPDKLVRNRGANVYKNMLRDDQVKSAFFMKLSLIVGRKMVFDADTPDQIEAAEFCERNITDLITGTWRKALKTIGMGKAWGYSLTEKVWKAGVVDGKPRWWIDKLKAKPWQTFEFITDEYGNKKSIVQNQGDKKKSMNPTKFIHYINMPEIDDLWGESDLKAAYRPYWEKDITQKMWNIYQERVAGGFIAATPNERIQNMDSGERSKFEKVISHIIGTSGVIVPNGYDIKIETPRDNRSFERAIDKRDIQIARALLLPNFLGYTEQGGVGSRAQSETVFNLFMEHIEEESEYLVDLINEDLFSQMCWWNFQLQDYPRAKFMPYTTEQKRAIALAWADAVHKGAVTNTIKDELRTRQLLIYPEMEKEELEKIKEERKPDFQPEPNNDQRPNKGDDDASQGDGNAGTPNQREAKQNNSFTFTFEDKRRIPAVAAPFEVVTTRGTNPSDSSHYVPITKQDYVDISEANQVDYEKPMFTERIDFASLEERLDTTDERFNKDLETGVDRVFKEVQAGMKKILNSQGKSKEVDKKEYIKKLNDSIDSKTKSFINKKSKAHLSSTYNLGRRTANKALSIAIEKAPIEAREKLQIKITLTEPKACLEKKWTVMHFIDGISVDAAEAWFSSTAFGITGDLTDTLVSQAAQIMIDGIRDEISVTEMVRNLELVLPDLLQNNTKRANRARLETIVRTNMSTIFTQAQLAFYADPDLNGFVQALEYSSVLDARTTIVCERLNGAKYAMDNPIWGHITPPNHFSCRSVLLPVTQFDDWRTSSKRYSSGQLPHKGFGKEGFPDRYLTEGARS